MTSENVRKALQSQVDRLDRRIVRLSYQSRTYSRIRIIIVVAAAILCFAAYQARLEPLFISVLAAGAGTFIFVARSHRLLDNGIRAHKKWRALKQQHIARIDREWGGLPEPPSVDIDQRHPFGNDLDLIGPRSMLHLMDVSVSRDGSQRLADWLLRPDPAQAIVENRQALVKEAQPLTLFRDKLTLLASLTGAEAEMWDGKWLKSWLEQDPGFSSGVRRTSGLLTALAILNILLFLGNLAGLIAPFWMISFVLYLTLFFARRKVVGELLSTALILYEVLESFRVVFEFVERYPFGTRSRLRQLCEPFFEVEHTPSSQMRKVRRLAAGAGVQSNPLIWLMVNIVFPWDFIFALRLNEARKRMSSSLPRWIDTWAELEAVNSLANFAYLHPEYVFPAVRLLGAAEDRPVLAAEDIGHPLIPADERICNSFSVRHLREVIIITGSNMAGKSTFLRTLGVNLQLAYTGAPVVAGSLVCGLFRLFSSIRVSDSIIEGVSFFYAEVKRLRQLLERLDSGGSELPVFFLIDEIFRGTNNRERLIGSRSYIRSLAHGNGSGLISTHDLELVKLADEMPGVSNYHFREEVIDGRMIFDYRLHEGPCPTTNALKIMAMEGLPVEDAE